jgi:hypothetical protein
MVAQVHERGITRRGSDINIAAFSTVAAVGAAEGDVCFFSETAAPVAAMATDNFNSDAIYKHGCRCCRPLFGRRYDINALPAFLEEPELHDTVREGEEGMILAQTTILARGELGAALANDDVARDGLLAAVELYTKAFGLTIAAVA